MAAIPHVAAEIVQLIGADVTSDIVESVRGTLYAPGHVVRSSGLKVDLPSHRWRLPSSNYFKTFLGNQLITHVTHTHICIYIYIYTHPYTHDINYIYKPYRHVHIYIHIHPMCVYIYIYIHMCQRVAAVGLS